MVSPMSDDVVRYARVDDGSHVAYRVRGNGTVDVLEISSYGTVFPFDAVEGQPRWRRFEERLGRFCRLIKFDHRGIGYSDKITAGPTLESWVADAYAVLEAVGCERVVLLATGQGALGAIEFASRYPDRVSSLILVNGYARFEWAPDYPIGAEIDVVELLASVADPEAAEGDSSDIDVMAPSLATDPDARRWWTRASRSGAGPSFAKAQWRTCVTIDVRERVEALELPALVMGTVGNEFVKIEYSRWLAKHFSGAQYRELPGADHTTWAIPGDAAVIQIEEFLTGSRSAGSGPRSLMAVLFTDIVESTARNADAGDSAWLDLLARHDALTDTEVRRRDGRVVKRLGDGLLAVFSLASDAIDAGLDVIARARDIGVGVRAAVHVAEIEHVNDDVLGLGVTIAARVLGHADGGEVLTSDIVAGLLTGSDFEFHSRGNFDLKGIPGKWELTTAQRPDTTGQPSPG